MSVRVISSAQAEVLAGVKQVVCDYVDVKLGSGDVVITESLQRVLLFHCCAAIGLFMLREHDRGQPYYSAYGGSGKFPLTVEGVKEMLCKAVDDLCEAGYLDVAEGDGQKLVRGLTLPSPRVQGVLLPWSRCLVKICRVSIRSVLSVSIWV